MFRVETVRPETEKEREAMAFLFSVWITDSLCCFQISRELEQRGDLETITS